LTDAPMTPTALDSLHVLRASGSRPLSLIARGLCTTFSFSV